MIPVSDIVDVDEASLFIFGNDGCNFRRCKKRDFRLSKIMQHDGHYRKFTRYVKLETRMIDIAKFKYHDKKVEYISITL